MVKQQTYVFGPKVQVMSISDPYIFNLFLRSYSNEF